MTRTEITKFLGKLLTDTRLGGTGSHWVSIKAGWNGCINKITGGGDSDD